MNNASKLKNDMLRTKGHTVLDSAFSSSVHSLKMKKTPVGNLIQMCINHAVSTPHPRCITRVFICASGEKTGRMLTQALIMLSLRSEISCSLKFLINQFLLIFFCNKTAILQNQWLGVMEK